MSCFQPASSPYADLYLWKSNVSIDPGDAAEPAGALTANDQIQFLADSFFCLMAFVGSTNYDNYAVNVPIGSTAQVIQARIPNNFSVLITQNNDQNLMAASAKMQQACICGSGYLVGNQVPYPVIWPPMTTINFAYEMISPFTLFSAVDLATQIDLEISFGLYGYNVPTQNLEAFLASWPAMQRIAQMNLPLWAQKFTAISIPGLTA